MDLGINLNPLKDVATPASPRPEAPSTAPATKHESFGSVLTARQAKPAAREAAPDDAPVESDSDAPEAPPAPVSLAPRKAAVVKTDEDLETEDAWAEFLTGMDEQLNVKPADVLSAFEHLSDDDLSAKPEDTTDQMVAAMGLTGQAAILAKQMLTKLIQRTDKPVETPVEGNPIADLHEAKALAQTLAPSLLNAKPAARAPSVPGADAVPLEEKSLADLTASSDDDVKAAPPKTAAPGAPAPAAAEFNAAAVPTPAKAVAPPVDAAAMNALVERMQPTDEAAGPRVDQIVRNLINGTPNQKAIDDVESAETSEVAGPAPRSASQALDALIAKATKHNADQPPADDEDDADLESELTTGDARLAQAPTKSSEFAAKLDRAQPVTATGPAAAPDLVENARLMVKDGGGEMKVTVNSEVGEIEMKVSVIDGKVSVQMVAETNEAKSILENQLGDLKTQLAAHHLQVDKLHVDTNSNLGQQSDQNPSRHDHQRPNTGFAQMNQQNRGQQRRETGEAPAPRGYRAPARAATNAAPAARTSSSNSRRLNVVA